MKLPRVSDARLPPAELTVFVVATAFYALIAAPGVGWMDSGELTAAAWNLGGAHPPGHPAHSLLGRLAALIPVGEIAFRVNLFSAAAMGAALAGVVALARRLVAERGAKLAGAPPDRSPPERGTRSRGVTPWASGVGVALAALAPAAMINATRAEVYAPVAALIVWSLVAAVAFLRPPRETEPDGRALLLAAFGFALAAAFHPVIAASAALPVAVAVAVRARRRLLRLAPMALALGLLALLSYAYLPARALAASPPLLIFGDPSTASGFFELVTGAVYRGNFSGSGALERFAAGWMMIGAGTGLGVLLGGLIGLGFGAATRLRGAATCLAVAICLALGAGLQDALNPDLPGYLLVALFVLAAGLAPLLAAALRLLPAELAAPGARARPIATAALLAPLVAVGFLAGGGEPLDRDDAPARLWAATVGALPPGPGLYFASGDHTLFAAQYERLVAGGRPDLVIAHEELCRDEWFLRHVKRMMPILRVPYVDDGLRGHTAERLAIYNMRDGRTVGGDLPSFARLRSRFAGAVGRAYQYVLVEADATDPARPPPDFGGHIGRRVAALVGVARGEYELERDRLAEAARAAGVAGRFTGEQMTALAGARPRPDRPPLLPLLPRRTRVLLHEEWMTDLFAEELAWRAGLPALRRGGGDTFEQRLHASWRALLSGDIEPGGPELLDSGRDAALATTRLLVELGRAPAVEKHLFAFLKRWPDDAGALALYGSLRFNQGDLANAEELFRRSIALAPEVAESRARLSVVLARLGKADQANAEWTKAVELDPTVPERLPAPDAQPPK